MFKVKKMVVVLMAFALLTTSACAVHHYEGAAVGGVIGGIAGALLDGNNPWRGGIIGAALGAVAGATLTDISVRGSKEAARSGRPVEYRTEDGRGVFRAVPVSDFYHPDEHTKYRKVHVRVWEDGRLIEDTVKEIRMDEQFERIL